MQEWIKELLGEAYTPSWRRRWPQSWPGAL